jgi:hypothetical protein
LFEIKTFDSPIGEDHKSRAKLSEQFPIRWSEYHEKRTKKQQRRQEKTSAEPERKAGCKEIQERGQELIKIIRATCKII